MSGANRKLTRAKWGNNIDLFISNGGNVMRRFKPQMYSSYRQKIFIAFLLPFTTKSAAIGKKTHRTNCVDSLTLDLFYEKHCYQDVEDF